MAHHLGMPASLSGGANSAALICATRPRGAAAGDRPCLLPRLRCRTAVRHSRSVTDSGGSIPIQFTVLTPLAMTDSPAALHPRTDGPCPGGGLPHASERG